jgi:hypothetical protein
MFHWKIKPKTQGVAREKRPVQIRRILHDKIDLKNTKEEPKEREARNSRRRGTLRPEDSGHGPLDAEQPGPSPVVNRAHDISEWKPAYRRGKKMHCEIGQNKSHTKWHKYYSKYKRTR